MLSVKTSALSLAHKALNLIRQLTSEVSTSMQPPQVSVFSVAGADTWIKPAGAKSIQIICVGGGSSGAAGSKQTSTASAAGGNGGISGNRTMIVLPASIIPDSVAITVGAGGIGPAGRNTVGTGAGVVGGGVSSFGEFLRAFGSITNLPSGLQQGSSASSGSVMQWGSGAGSPGGTKTNNTASVNGTDAFLNGGLSFNSLVLVPALGGASGTVTGGDGLAGQAGPVIPSPYRIGTGGAGGGATHVNDANGGRGGDGIAPGAGGGGGGASGPGVGFSGAGGNGADGIVIVTTFFNDLPNYLGV